MIQFIKEKNDKILFKLINLKSKDKLLIKEKKKMIKVGFLGAGNIAHTLAQTFLFLKDKYELYGVASKENKRSEEFKNKYGFKKAYKDYEEMLNDKDIELVYISTTIAEHYKHIKMCLEHNKKVLCEKAFCASYSEAKEVVSLARKKNLFLAEAIWTRYMPSRGIITSLILSGAIGDPYYIEANLGYRIFEKERIYSPFLGGGALLDVGVYPLNFIDMFVGDKIKEINTMCKLFNTGVDETIIGNITFNNGIMAQFFTTINDSTSRDGYIYGKDGYLKVININNPEKIEIYKKEEDKNYASLVSSINVKEEFNGYEYELMETYSSITSGHNENPSMSLDDTLKMMKIYEDILVKSKVKRK